MRTKQGNAALFVLYAFLAFPLFYFVYKFGTPNLGMIDFFDYYKLYESMDVRAADSPLNMRLVSSFFVYLFNKMGFYYDTATNVDQLPFNKRIYFNAVFFNYLCVVTTSMLTFSIVRKDGQSVVISFCAGLFYLLGFGTIHFAMMPITDAFSTLLFAVVLFLYLKKSLWIVPALLLAIFQREYIFFALGLIAILDYFQHRNNYFLIVFGICVVCFLIYFITRQLYFETARYAYQTNVGGLLKSALKFKFPLIPFLKQLFITLNLFTIYVALVGYKILRGIPYNRFEFIKILCLFAQLLVLAFLLGLGNNSGRYFYFLTPLFLLEIARELKHYNIALHTGPAARQIVQK